MKKIIVILGVLYTYGCTKTEAPSTPPPIVVQEESIKFTTNIDTGTFYVIDTLPLIITVSSKLPASGVLVSVISTWTDSSKQIHKIDTTIMQPGVSINIPGLKKEGTYSIAVTITSKNTLSNTVSKSLSAINSAIRNFTGYKVASNARQLGSDYWLRGTGVMADLIIQTFQNPLPNSNSYAYQHNFINTGWTSSTCGDFNNDGYIDVFTPGGGQYIGFSFLLYNPITKTFKDTSLLKDKTIKLLTKSNNSFKRSIPVYLNSDNYVDLIIIEGDNFSNPTQILYSDGMGGYELTSFDALHFVNSAKVMTDGGDVGDLNGDGLPDLVLAANNFTFIYWGKSSYPFFRNDNYTILASDLTNFPNVVNNGTVCSSCSNGVFDIVLKDLNKDNKLDFLLCVVENSNINQRVILNKGTGLFSNSDVLNLPTYARNIQVHDYTQDEVNGDIIAQNGGGINNIFSYWNIYKYKNNNGSYSLDTTSIKFNYNTKQYDGNKGRLLYYDFNKDGIKDIGYIDASWGGNNGTFNPVTRQGNIMPFKTVFIKRGDQYIEEDYYQYDSYAKSLLTILKNRFK